MCVVNGKILLVGKVSSSALLYGLYLNIHVRMCSTMRKVCV